MTFLSRLLLVAALWCTTVAVAGGGDIDRPIEKLLDHIQSVGGELSDSAAVKSLGRYRGVFATRDIPAGHVLAKIPISAAVTVARAREEAPADVRKFMDLISGIDPRCHPTA